MPLRVLPLRVLLGGFACALLAGPAWADCAADVAALDEQLIAAETGAPAEGGMPATEHQAEVLSGDAQTSASNMPATEHQEQVLSGGEPPLETGAGATGDVEAASPHQRQVVREVDDDSKAQAGTLLQEARASAEAGDEAGCEQKLSEARRLLGQP